jgi:hypothetical protein
MMIFLQTLGWQTSQYSIPLAKEMAAGEGANFLCGARRWLLNPEVMTERQTSTKSYSVFTLITAGFTELATTRTLCSGKSRLPLPPFLGVICSVFSVCASG